MTVNQGTPEHRLLAGLLTVAALVLAVATLALGLVWHRVRERERHGDRRDWQVLHVYETLPREFIWTLPLETPPPPETRLRLRFPGETRLTTVEFSERGVALWEDLGPRERREISRADWSPALAPGERIDVVKTVDRLTVFRNAVRVLAAPLAIETWRTAIWEGTGLPSTPDPARLQKTEPVLFADDFMHDSGGLGEWTARSGTWRVHALQNPVRSANPFSLHGNGVSAVIETGFWFWRNYEFGCSVHPLGDSALGLRFCIAGPDTGYELSWRRSREDGLGWLRLLRTADGATALLAETYVSLLPEHWSRLAISQLDGFIAVMVDGRRVMHAVDPKPLLGGRIGLWAGGTDGAVFDDVEVTPASTLVCDFGEGQNVLAAGSAFGGRLPADAFEAGGLNLERLDDALALFGAARENAALTVELTPTPDWHGGLELAMRATAGAGRVVLKLARDRGATTGTVELVEELGGVPRTLDRARWENPERPVRVALHVLESDAWAALDGQPLCVATGIAVSGRGQITLRRIPGGGTLHLARFEVGSQMPMPSIENRVETFSHEESMQGWSTPAAEWLSDGRIANRHWHRGDFWQDVSAESPAPSAGDASTATAEAWGLALRGTPNAGAEAPGLVSAMVEKRAAGEALVVSGASPTTDVLALDEPARTLTLSRRHGRIIVRVNGRTALTLPLPAGLGALCQVGRIGRGAPETWASTVAIHADGVRTYSFKEAPVDWMPVAGVWDVTNRWECDPRWSFFSGTASTGVACNWSKGRHGRNVTLEFFAAPRMDRERGRNYEYAADINAVLAADGRDVTSGYSFLFGGWNDRGSQIVRGSQTVAENRQMLIPRAAGIHHRWFHVKIRKHGDAIAFWVDGAKVADFQDPEPLAGDRLGIWTWNNGIMIAQVRVSTDSPFEAAPMPNATATPRVPYDDAGNP